MSVQVLIQSILQLNQELNQQVQVMTALTQSVNQLKTEIHTNFSNTNVSQRLLAPLEATKQSLEAAIPSTQKAKQTLEQLTATLRG
ncbi:TPA: hypothetical protein TXN53_000906 [Streptococcus suis]|uniref:hypothetical protein n=1 Tax=Streptococcus suis TaxID=1307 RepID=UPI002A7C39AC|nr:hypothetical protein [Streptococcus suis]HEM2740866.1 hypothetical protein [Streptococcus suis]HEP1798575.1 hypothetical protein [Streptococcus suis]